jgi:AraC-like DNA-binding protein
MKRIADPPVIVPFVPQTVDGVFVEAQWLGPDHVLHRMGLHGHAFFELMLIRAGGGYHRVGHTMHEVRPGDLFIIPPGEIHDCSELGSAQAWVLLFTHQALESHTRSMAFCWSWLPRHPLFVPFLTLSHGQPGPLRLDAAAMDRWSANLAAIADETESRAPGYQYGVHAHLSLLLLDLCRRTGSPSYAEVASVDPVLEAVFSFIEKNYKREIRLADLARVAGRSAAHLTSTLRQRTGLTAQEWVTERLMSETRRLLVQSNRSLQEIAADVGYFDPASLVRSFSRLHRLTPAAWRQAHRQGPIVG